MGKQIESNRASNVYRLRLDSADLMYVLLAQDRETFTSSKTLMNYVAPRRNNIQILHNHNHSLFG